jgi:hypothetical protein
MLTQKVTCDHCCADITDTGNELGYRLNLSAERLLINCKAMAVTAMMVYPPINRDHHFCGLNCLREWLNVQKTPRP